MWLDQAPANAHRAVDAMQSSCLSEASRQVTTPEAEEHEDGMARVETLAHTYSTVARRRRSRAVEAVSANAEVISQTRTVSSLRASVEAVADADLGDDPALPTSAQADSVLPPSRLSV
jgi:hypothetical protein